MKLLVLGRKCLQVAATKLNLSSSRSHALFTIKVVRMADISEPKFARLSSLTFCDLAGSERSFKAETFGQADRLREAGNINTSLLTFGRCVETLRYNQLHHDKPKWVPYRESKLTRVFQAFFTGHGKACMIVNASQNADIIEETLHTLRFSAVARNVNIISSHNPSLALEDEKENINVKAFSLPSSPLQKVDDDNQSETESELLSPDESMNDSMINALKLFDKSQLISIIKSLKEKLTEVVSQAMTVEMNTKKEAYEMMDRDILRMEQRYSQNIKEMEIALEAEMKSRQKAESELLKMRQDLSDDLDTSDSCSVDANSESFEDLDSLEEYEKDTTRAEKDCKSCNALQSDVDEYRLIIQELEADISNRDELISKLQYELDEVKTEFLSVSTIDRRLSTSVAANVISTPTTIIAKKDRTPSIIVPDALKESSLLNESAIVNQSNDSSKSYVDNNHEPQCESIDVEELEELLAIYKCQNDILQVKFCELKVTTSELEKRLVDQARLLKNNCIPKNTLEREIQTDSISKVDVGSGSNCVSLVSVASQTDDQSNVEIDEFDEIKQPKSVYNPNAVLEKEIQTKKEDFG